MNNIRIVMTGPLPPAIGGMATVIDDISHSSLSDKIDLVLVNTSKTTSDGRSIFTAVVTRLKLLIRCAKLLRQRKDSILHIHTCSGFTFFLDGTILLVGKILRVPVVLHIHGGRFDKFLDELSLLTFSLARWIAKRATRVVVLSASWEKILSSRLPKTRIEVIENGVPVSAMRSTTPPENDDVQLLYLGNLYESKGVWDLMSATEKVFAETKNIRLVYAGGEGEAGIAEKLQQRADTGPLKSCYQWRGPVYAEAKKILFAESDIFILPSYVEGLPISLLEAMCAGLPVIVTPVGAIPSVVSDEAEGLIVPPGDVKALENAIRRMVSDKKWRQRIAKNSYKRCSEAYNIERVAGRYLALYKSLT